jgi:decaprenylphospho-beta-D-ribofuranose 2-oxidase
MRTSFSSLDCQTRLECDYAEPDRYRDLLRNWDGGPIIARGAGLSYVAASFGAKARSVGLRRFNRILGFDPVSGTIEVEAGVSLGEVQAYLDGHGRTLAVQPGYPGITIGGCIAFDVHGKNQYKDGLFHNIVVDLALFHPDRGQSLLSRDSEPDLFDLTCGGFGLTGIILHATLRTEPLTARSVRQELLPVASLTETIERIDACKDNYDFAYSWNDLSRGTGAGFLITGRHFDDEVIDDGRYRPLVPGRSRLPLPLLRRETAWMVNALYLFNLQRQRVKMLSRFDFTYPAARLGFYFELFGRRGFLEHQVLVPRDRWREWLREFERLVRRGGEPSVLTTVKSFKGKRSLLRYDGDGFSVAIDLPATPEATRLLGELDALDCEMGCLGNIHKDSRLSAAVIARQYAGYEEFKARLGRWDPERRFDSALRERLKL